MEIKERVSPSQAAVMPSAFNIASAKHPDIL